MFSPTVTVILNGTKGADGHDWSKALQAFAICSPSCTSCSSASTSTADEREQKARDFMRAEMRYHRAIEDLKTKQLQIQDHEKKFRGRITPSCITYI